MKLNKRLIVKYSSKEECAVILTILMGGGYKIMGDETPIHYSNNAEHWKYVVVNGLHLDLTNNDYDDLPKFHYDDLPSLVKFLEAEDFSCELTDEYSATITKKGIVVGCQTIPFDNFATLASLVTRFKAQ